MRVGVIGGGGMGQNHVRVLRNAGADLAGVADAMPGRAQQVGARMGVAAYPDVRSMLEDPAVEAVTIAVTTEAHAEVALAAIAAGKHLLVEKPLASTSKEAKDLVDAARRAGVVLATGHVERFNPVVEWAREATRKNQFGDIVGLQATRVGPMPPRATPEGVIHDLAVHDIDVVRYITQRDVQRVTAVSKLGGPAGTRGDHSTLVLDLGDGIAACLVSSWLTPMKVRKLAVTCKEGYLELDYIQQVGEVSHGHAKIDPTNLFDSPWEYEVRRFPMRRAEPLQIELMDFLEAAANGRAPRCTGEDGLRAVQVAEAAIESVARGQSVAGAS